MQYIYLIKSKVGFLILNFCLLLSLAGSAQTDNNYYESFSSNTSLPAGWKVLGSAANNDPIWKPYKGAYAFEGKTTGNATSYALECTAKNGSKTDTWAFVKGVSMKAGKTYYLGFYAQVKGADNNHTIEVSAGAAQVTAGQMNLSTLTIIGGMGYQNMVSSFKPTTDGTYHFAFRCTTTGRQGSLYLDEVSVTDTNTSGSGTEANWGPPTTLPVSLISFSAAKKNTDAVLEWQTALEKSSLGFEVETSTDGKIFSKISFVASTNSSTGSHYTYNHKAAGKNGGIKYYRLKQVDLDGTATYFSIKTVDFGQQQVAVTAYPNPFAGAVQVTWQATEKGNAIISLVNGVGKEVLRKTVAVEQGVGQQQIEVPTSNPAGMYLLTISVNGKQHTSRLLKQ